MREHGLCLFSFNIWSWLCWWVVGDFFFLPALHDPGRFLVNPSSGSKVADKPTFSKHRKSTAATSGNHEENPSETKKKKNIQRYWTIEKAKVAILLISFHPYYLEKLSRSRIVSTRSNKKPCFTMKAQIHVFIQRGFVFVCSTLIHFWIKLNDPSNISFCCSLWI